MKKLKLFRKTFLYTFSLMIVIVAVSHLLVYILLPTVYHYRQRNVLEADIEKLCREITDTEDAGRLALVTDFAGKWYADILVKYDGYAYEMKLLNVGDDGYLKCSEDTENPSGDKEDVSIIAEESDGKIKISLSRNPKGDKNFLYAEQIFPNQKGYVRAVISRQQIEDAVSTIIVILPVTAFACTLISLLSALLYSHMLTKPIKQITNVTKQMQGLTHGISCEVHTHDEIETLADNVNALYNNLLKTIHNLEQEIYKAEETEGRHITAEDTDAAVISAKLAEENNLGIGSALILKSASDGSGEQAKVFVAGIYASDSKMEYDDDTIFTTHDIFWKLSNQKASAYSGNVTFL